MRPSSDSIAISTRGPGHLPLSQYSTSEEDDGTEPDEPLTPPTGHFTDSHETARLHAEGMSEAMSVVDRTVRMAQEMQSTNSTMLGDADGAQDASLVHTKTQDLQSADGSSIQRKEPPSMLDVPAGFRRKSPDRSRQMKRTSTSGPGQAIAASAPASSFDAPSQGIARATTSSGSGLGLPEAWRPPTPPNHLREKKSSEPPKNRHLFSRSNTGFFGKLRRSQSSNKDLDSLTSNPRDSHSPFDDARPNPLANRRPSMSQSRRNTPDTSVTHTPTPPSPGSEASTPDPQEDDHLKRITTTGGQTHSRSGSVIKRASTFQPTIAWDTPGSSSARSPRHEMQRRRSQSAEHIPKPYMRPVEKKSSDTQQPVVLRPTISQSPAAGVGLKARRLSAATAQEIQVNSCELNDEYKSNKALFGRGKKLGKGATSEVTIMCTKGSKDDLVAVKEFRGKDNDENNAEYVQKVKSEFCIARSLHHPNIVETRRLCTHAGRWNHVMEYCELGDIYHLVEKGLFKTHYTAKDRHCFFKQILRAVDYLHSHGIAHRDIKLENLLLTNGGAIKLTDFGVSEVFCGEHPGLQAAGGECGKNMGAVRTCAPGLCGSLPYIAPEVLSRDHNYDPRPLDVWSAAITYITMTFGGPPWRQAAVDEPNYARFIEGWDKWLANNPDGVIKNEDGGWPSCGKLFDSIEPGQMKRNVLKMLHPEPRQRITVREVLNGGYFKGIECCTPESYDPTASAGGMKGLRKQAVLPKHDHLPPREERTPAFLKHRWDMGDGYNDGVRMKVI